MKTILALETSCDETAVAILRGRELLGSEVASQTAEHEPYGGVVPEVASRNHLVHAPKLLRVTAKSAGISLAQVDAFVATSGPGLASSLMIGTSIAKGLALGFGKPYLAVNHLEGHLLSPFFGSAREIQPNVALVVSGGHTLLAELRGLNDYDVLGRTLDDAAGEAFDKVAKMLGLGYPGGPEIERRARYGDRARFDFPRSMLNSRDHNFSFSGLKTAVRYLLEKFPRAMESPTTIIPSEVGEPHGTVEHSTTGSEGLFPGTLGRSDSLIPDHATRSHHFARDDRVLNDFCASFQQAVIDVLVKKTLRAARECRLDCVTLSGGVSCNIALREQLRHACDEAGIELVATSPPLCTDNAAMIAFAAALRFGSGFLSRVTDEIDPNLALV